MRIDESRINKNYKSSVDDFYLVSVLVNGKVSCQRTAGNKHWISSSDEDIQGLFQLFVVTNGNGEDTS